MASVANLASMAMGERLEWMSVFAVRFVNCVPPTRIGCGVEGGHS